MDRLAHRKTTARIQLKNADGTPAALKSVHMKQVSSRFLFGCGGFDVLELVSGSEREAFLTERMEKWLKLYNYATLPFYWGNYEPEEGKPYEAVLLKAAGWFRERGVRVKGHPLCWHTVCAPWLLKYSDSEIMEKQLARIHRDVSAFRGMIDMWDVINETVIMPVFDKYDNAVTRICNAYGRNALVRQVFDAAKAENPGAELLINDFNTSPAYEQVLEELLENGVPITAIGIQSHQHQGYWGLDKLHDVLDRFSRFGLPIHFTENTLISGDLMPPEIEDLNDFVVSEWPTTPAGEERQAREMAEMYTELFSHPLVEAVTAWEAVDGYWLHAPSGVLRADNSEKPAFAVMDELINRTWKTDTTLVTDENGFLDFTGFRGGYTVSCGDRHAVWNTEDAGAVTLSK